MERIHEQLDLVIGELESDIPANSTEAASGTCVRIYCEL